eukprot:857105-Rhodomonas_salina.1
MPAALTNNSGDPFPRKSNIGLMNSCFLSLGTTIGLNRAPPANLYQRATPIRVSPVIAKTTLKSLAPLGLPQLTHEPPPARTQFGLQMPAQRVQLHFQLAGGRGQGRQGLGQVEVELTWEREG